ncbi:MAG TPA: sporadic carbohydrate cluster 2OG-Fe(II) oxygenase [Hypericibacter adhaerens]|jgi:sporadic carbohydrate cluster 2OG-Fe(II) oxygenase|uniref:sporadic carbohydrate cluster 2OG-Fe(II) oxygenase n=1 Tax=Hypericibacter adhaerens TaxID=2602016 RepID=UPI002CE8A532|nr:sporadic carbohydrate cluster 2OG-Fe(II) oxygenase [Hypericibacter adhaerens]HWA44563.1 sporadic carbohydrate cluster 2OG-Fe(II) oxygenase [Hypericibacter adhaerens]
MADRDPGTGFFDAADAARSETFLKDGYIIGAAEDRTALDRIRALIAGIAAKTLDLPSPNDPDRFLNRIGEHVAPAKLNDFRLAIIKGMNAEPWLRQAYFAAARAAVQCIVGNELCMQRRINLSIQLPGDTSSLLPVHSDTWSGDSPFEVVLWIPLVDCYRTKSMYLLPPAGAAEIQRNLAKFSGRSAEDVFRDIERDVVWLEIPYGNFLLFNQNLPHGNRVNDEADARWSMNCRFKGVFTPYADKKLGEFFEPITLRAASRIGLDYQAPGNFEE